MQQSLTIQPLPKRVATLLCEMFISENKLVSLLGEMHLIISLHHSYVKNPHRDVMNDNTLTRYVEVIFFCFNVKYCMVFIEYMLR